MIEEYKDIPNYEGCYQVSNMGNVRSLDRYVNSRNGLRISKSVILKPCISVKYLCVALLKDGKSKTMRIHMLMAITFLGHTPSRKIVVDHIDNCKTNNNLDNLQIITARWNCSKDKKGSSKYTGVFWNNHRSKWASSIWMNGKAINLGVFDTEIEASNSYQAQLLKD